MTEIDILSVLLSKIDVFITVLNSRDPKNCTEGVYDQFLVQINVSLVNQYKIRRLQINGQTIWNWFNSDRITQGSAKVELIAAYYFLVTGVIEKETVNLLIGSIGSKKKYPQKYWNDFKTEMHNTSDNASADFDNQSSSSRLVAKSFIDEHLNTKSFEFAGVYSLYRFSSEKNRVYKYPLLIDTFGSVLLKDESDTTTTIMMGIALKIPPKRLIILFDKKRDTQNKKETNTFQCIQFCPDQYSIGHPDVVDILQGISLRRTRKKESVASKDLLVRMKEINMREVKFQISSITAKSRKVEDDKLRDYFNASKFTELWLPNAKIPKELKKESRKSYSTLDKLEKQIVTYVSKWEVLLAEPAELTKEYLQT